MSRTMELWECVIEDTLKDIKENQSGFMSSTSATEAILFLSKLMKKDLHISVH